MATYLIGDIQGCIDPLQELLDTINFDPAADRLWPCGDLVNRGGSSLEVLRLLHSVAPRVAVTLGNHDLHLLAEDARRPNGGSKNKEFEAILRAADRRELLDWLNSQPLAAWEPEHRLLRVHAGVVPAWSWQDTINRAAEIQAVLQSDQRRRFLRKMYNDRPKRWRNSLSGWRRLRVITNILCRLRVCDAQNRLNLKFNGPPGKKRKSYKPWYRHKNRKTRDVRVAFGHWAALGLRIRKRTLALDSGCVWGGSLTAYRLEDGEVIQVPGLKRRR